MKTSTKAFASTVFLFLMCLEAKAQLLVENFSYTSGTNLTANGWTTITGASSPTTVANSGLTFSGYSLSGIGNAALLNANAGGGHEIYGKSFTSQTSGSIYVSFLVNASAIDQTPNFNFFLSLYAAVPGGAYGRFTIEDNGSNLRFGLAQFTEDIVYTPFSYAFNTTYLVVVKYTIVSGSTNDEASLFVFTSTPPVSEPAPTLGPVSSANTDPADIGIVAVWRSQVSDNSVLLDGIRVGTSWNDAPLPVELTSFKAAPKGSTIEFAWQTATETNNYGFEIERRQIRNSSLETDTWSKVGFVAGAGTNSSQHEYTFVDGEVSYGRYAYRIKQVNKDGSFKYTGEVEVEVGLAPKEFTLVQNYPNPFNPTTNIEFTVPQDGKVQLKVYNTLGEEVATLLDETMTAGEYHRVSFDASRLVSGIYFARIQFANRQLVKKMLLVK